jgi:hypothetical protein
LFAKEIFWPKTKICVNANTRKKNKKNLKKGLTEKAKKSISFKRKEGTNSTAEI